jgi:hypothetical protein
MLDEPKPGDESDGLFKHVPDFEDFSTAMTALAERAPERLTLSQMVFFLLAGVADLRGQPATFSQIKEDAGSTINRSLHTTYKVFLEGKANRRKDRPNHPAGMGWLTRTTNPDDEREKFLRLTPEGRDVFQALLGALTREH